MKIETKYDIQEIVYLITDNEQLERMITGFTVTSTGIIYRLAYATNESWHYDFEFVKEKTFKL
jgi:hypothetical protein